MFYLRKKMKGRKEREERKEKERRKGERKKGKKGGRKKERRKLFAHSTNFPINCLVESLKIEMKGILNKSANCNLVHVSAYCSIVA